MTTDLARRVPSVFEPETLESAVKLAQFIAKSALVPQAYRGHPEDIVVAWMKAKELGISLSAAMAGIAVVKGRPMIWGDLGPALCERSGQMEYLKREWDEATQTGTCRLKRKGHPEVVVSFSMADAQRAGLAKPRGESQSTSLYVLYPQRMCTWRAVNWAVREAFPDALAGMDIADDPPEESDVLREPEIAMPQPRSDAEVLADLAKGGGQDARASQAGNSAEAAPDRAAAPAVLRVVATRQDVQSDKTPAGRKWTRHEIDFSDGRTLSTFSLPVLQAAQAAQAADADVLIETKPGREPGHVALTGLTIAPGAAEKGQGGE